ncbi:MAG: hydroxymethylpyrimidine/phosphomethylpyrimidine kinase [Gammaproteobacteria bacterium]|nr:hydroxymethylpyrimidine/phosphomethylpyrimidine kinase [Gammaproteobacteria bacterium]
MDTTAIPVVLVFGGTDPTGGAGLQADIETIAALGAHAAPVVTAVTVQNTTNAIDFAPQPGALVVQQARRVLEDIRVSAFKIGMTGSVEVVEAIASILGDNPDIPMVLDPVLTAGGGATLSEDSVADAIRESLIPLATIATPNSLEARRLARGPEDLVACAESLIRDGARFVLVTGTHEDTGAVINTLYSTAGPLDTCRWDRLPGSYHGSGCTLASAIGALLAARRDAVTASREAQRYTWNALKHGFRPGLGQFLPDRFHGMR